MDDSERGLSRASRGLIHGVIGLGIFSLGIWIGARFATPSAPESAPTDPPTAARPVETATAEEPAPFLPERLESELPPAEQIEVPFTVGARVALVIDDLGRSLRDLEALEALGVPVTYSVLPFETMTPQVVAEVNRQGWELMCHLPMEPESGANPGLGALTSKMNAAELADATRAALAAVPGAVGVNNHMGSSLSADEAAMDPILEVVRERGLFFLDSRTSGSSVGYRVALAHGVPAVERQVFLDPELTTEAIEQQFDRLLWLAEERGQAVAIGHPHASTLEVLARRVPQAVEEGFEFVPVSYLLDRAAPLE